MFKFLVYLLLFYVVFKFLFGGIFKVNMYNFNQFNQQKPNHNEPEGTITINESVKNAAKKSGNSKIGEYVDYEEVK